MFKINDEIEIWSAGYYFPTHEEAARKLRIKNWKPNVGPQNGDEGVITNIWEEDEYHIFYSVDIGRAEIIIGPHGIKKKQEWDDAGNR